MLLVIWWFSIKVGFRKPGCSSVPEWHCLCCTSVPCLLSSLELRCVLVDLSLPVLFCFVLTLAALCLHCCTCALSSCREQGLLFVAGCRLLVAVASRCRARAIGLMGSFGCGLSLLWGTWDLPRLGTEPVSPALAGGFLSTEPPGKSQTFRWYNEYFHWDNKHKVSLSQTDWNM